MIEANFNPPHSATLISFKLDLLCPKFADDDFAAVCASANLIRHLFGPSNAWPKPNITFEENLADLARHEREFLQKYAFAYALLDITGQNYLGCFYLNPINLAVYSNKKQTNFSAQAFVWVSSLHNTLTVSSAQAELSQWLAETWGLKAIAWPGRVQTWEEWQTLTNNASL